MIFAILATGESMNQSVADYVRGKCKVIAVSDAYKLAPWADALVSNDSAWWRANPQALKFAGAKYCAAQLKGTIRILPEGGFESTSNSGLLAMRVAQKLGATKILLLGFDMKGSHFFGKHPDPLGNTTAKRFVQHIKQFGRWHGCEVINCTPDSALRKFPFAAIEDILGGASG